MSKSNPTTRPYTERQAVRLVKRVMDLLDQHERQIAELRELAKIILAASEQHKTLLRVLYDHTGTRNQH